MSTTGKRRSSGAAPAPPAKRSRAAAAPAWAPMFLSFLRIFGVINDKVRSYPGPVVPWAEYDNGALKELEPSLVPKGGLKAILAGRAELPAAPTAVAPFISDTIRTFPVFNRRSVRVYDPRHRQTFLPNLAMTLLAVFLYNFTALPSNIFMWVGIASLRLSTAELKTLFDMLRSRYAIRIADYDLMSYFIDTHDPHRRSKRTICVGDPCFRAKVLLMCHYHFSKFPAHIRQALFRLHNSLARGWAALLKHWSTTPPEVFYNIVRFAIFMDSGAGVQFDNTELVTMLLGAARRARFTPGLMIDIYYTFALLLDSDHPLGLQLFFPGRALLHNPIPRGANTIAAFLPEEMSTLFTHHTVPLILPQLLLLIMCLPMRGVRPGTRRVNAPGVSSGYTAHVRDMLPRDAELTPTQDNPRPWSRYLLALLDTVGGRARIRAFLRTVENECPREVPTGLSLALFAYLNAVDRRCAALCSSKRLPPEVWERIAALG
jgi:hypothetical protein